MTGDRSDIGENIIVQYGGIYRGNKGMGLIDYMYAIVDEPTYEVELYAEKPLDLSVPAYEFLKEKIIKQAEERGVSTNRLCFCPEGWNLKYGNENRILHKHECWQKNIMHVEDYSAEGEIIW